MVVAALIEVDNDIQLRHAGRLLRRARNNADVALAGMPKQMRSVRAEGVLLQSDLRGKFDDVPPSSDAALPRVAFSPPPNLANGPAAANERLNMFDFPCLVDALAVFATLPVAPLPFGKRCLGIKSMEAAYAETGCLGRVRCCGALARV